MTKMVSFAYYYDFYFFRCFKNRVPLKTGRFSWKNSQPPFIIQFHSNFYSYNRDFKSTSVLSTLFYYIPVICSPIMQCVNF